MKRVVLCDDLHESDIRPEPLYGKYKDLLESESRKLFAPETGLSSFRCPNCGEVPRPVYTRWDARYGRCACLSLLVSPRPSQTTLDHFRLKSKALAFWQRSLERAADAARKQSLYEPRLQWLLNTKDQYQPPTGLLVDYRTRYPGFLDMVRKSGEFSHVLTMPPVPASAKGKAGLFLAFEVLERMAEPETMVREAAGCLASGGVLLLTTGTSNGLEYQILGARAPNLNPLDRLNLFSIEALQGLLAKSGFEILELSTPGRLDVETVQKALAAQPDIPGAAFWRYLFARRGEEAWHALQEFLQQHQLSSHVRLAARKL